MINEMVYLSFPITGKSLTKIHTNVGIAIDAVQSQGGKIINPLVICDAIFGSNKDWKERMKICMVLIDLSDAICMLPDWSKSDGCRCEYFYAKGLKKKLYRYNDLQIIGDRQWNRT